MGNEPLTLVMVHTAQVFLNLIIIVQNRSLRQSIAYYYS